MRLGSGRGSAAHVTHKWAERGDADLTKNVRAQNQLLFAVRIPPVKCMLSWAGFESEVYLSI